MLLPSDRQYRHVTAALRSRKRKYKRRAIMLWVRPGWIGLGLWARADLSENCKWYVSRNRQQMRKGQCSGKKDKVMGSRGWGRGGGTAFIKIPEESSNIPASSEYPLGLMVEEWAKVRGSGLQRVLQLHWAWVAAAAPWYSGSKRGWFVLPNCLTLNVKSRRRTAVNNRSSSSGLLREGQRHQHGRSPLAGVENKTLPGL